MSGMEDIKIALLAAATCAILFALGVVIGQMAIWLCGPTWTALILALALFAGLMLGAAIVIALRQK